jgi:hypothetical protein
MAKKLGHEDGRAVDLLLNGELTMRSNGSGGGTGNGGNGAASDDGSAAVVSRGQGNFRSRLESVERVLRLLDEMPSADPPSDLAARTLRRIDEARLAPASAATRGRSSQPHAGGAGTRPHA